MSKSDEWCDFNDMPKAGCAHCQGTPELVENVKPELEDVIIIARKDGICPECKEPIVAGKDHIGRVKHQCGAFDEQPCHCYRPWVHYGCGR